MDMGWSNPQQLDPTQPNPWFFELTWPNPTHIPEYHTPQEYC